jgi:subtilisin family serine protease
MINSSQGPTRDGRLKPEIAAPGANTFSCGVMSELPFFIANAPQVVAIGGYHIQGGGTSAASPVVAGTAALCLERNPTANWQQIYDAIIYCARTDAHTGSTNTQPNVIWGYGKVDAFSTITNCFLTTTGPEILQNENELFLYPNPVIAGESFTVQLKDPANSIRIINLMGETVRIFIVPQQQKNLTLTTANLAPGLYLLQLDAGSTTRMVIQ